MNGIQLPAGVSRNKQIAANMTMWGPHQEERSPYLHLKIAHSSHFGIWQGHNPISGSMAPHQSEDLSQNDFLLNGHPILSLYFNFVFINFFQKFASDWARKLFGWFLFFLNKQTKYRYNVIEWYNVGITNQPCNEMRN